MNHVPARTSIRMTLRGLKAYHSLSTGPAGDPANAQAGNVRWT